LTYDQAVDAALCFGWIDGQRRSLPEPAANTTAHNISGSTHFAQRFTPRRSASIWSKRNVDKITAFLAQTPCPIRPAGLAQIQELVAQRLGEFDADLPVLVTGDFNVAAEASEPYDTLVGKAGLVDTWTAAEERLSPAYATFHGYRPPEVGGHRIDWILARPGVRVPVAAINTFTLDGRWASDHWPVQALVELPRG
jgi:endonuclease/exonuclease/phosphatase (EEP) superfamily protein YafD